MRALTPLALIASATAQVFEAPYTIHAGDVDSRPIPSLTKRKQFEPCGEVAQLWAAQKAANSKPGATPSTIRVPAQRAYDCLTSVPVDAQGDIKEIQELKAYLEYHSTLTWLKKGVKDQIEPLDVMGELDLIIKGLNDKTYKNDYEVQLSIRRTLDKAGDFHLAFTPDITNIFYFLRPEGILVSISEDGIALPKIYLVSDLPKDTNGKITGSAVEKINGQNATEYLQKLSEGARYHDADARYNTVFPNPALNAMGAKSGGLAAEHYIYAGPITTYTFANGTDKKIDNIAVIPAIYDFSKVTDGPSFFKAFCTGPPTSTTPVTPGSSSAKPSGTPRASSKASSVVKRQVASATPRPSPSLIGYPKPVFIQESKVISGYYLGDNNKDVAVLVLPGFAPSSTVASAAIGPVVGGFIDAQKLLRSFFADAVKQNKKKLVIDLRGNGGGLIDMGFELFKQLFPQTEPYGAARYRAHEAFHYYSAIVADLAVRGKGKDGVITAVTDADYGVQSNFLWSNILDENNKPYNTYQDYYGPSTINGDTFTSVRRYNFSNNKGGHTLPATLTGYNEFKNAPAQPFQPENIVIIQDGFCGSTCAIFSELMREQGKVQTIVIGGRPRNAPMQGVGGSKGSQVLSLDKIYTFAEDTIDIAKALNGVAVAEKLNETAVGKIYNAEQIYIRTAIPKEGESLVGGVNSLNNQRRGDKDQTPLEFIYEAADCRLFYTTATLLDPVNLWKQAIEAKWGKGKCVPGSTGHTTAIGTVDSKPGFGAKGSSTQGAALFSQLTLPA
ncbi:hypothetical protein GQ44DRAFT_688498 [Phaeosphaeriaceae sp. PMI808]|nr:hypothetical protein GQ44DRAFT_688498 [Phaeosphaeriaceae sp. PMI808]